MTAYTVHSGITLKDGTRLEPGERYEGRLPAWLVRQGHATADTEVEE